MVLKVLSDLSWSQIINSVLQSIDVRVKQVHIHGHRDREHWFLLTVEAKSSLVGIDVTDISNIGTVAADRAPYGSFLGSNILLTSQAEGLWIRSWSCS